MNFEWAPTECADEKFPMQIVQGEFIFPDDQRLYIPEHKVIHNGWGKYGSSHVVGDPLKPLPDRIEITWFSYAEDRFYTGLFSLKLGDLTARFEEGFISPRNGHPTTYNRILVGLAPEGGVTIWLGGHGIMRRFCDAQAIPANIPWNTVLDNADVSREHYIRMVLTESLGEDGYRSLLKQGVPAGYWNRLRQRFNWRFDVHGVDGIQIWIRTMDGQREFTNLEKDRGGFTCGCLPKAVDLDWLNPQGKQCSAALSFDEQETYAAFEKMAAVAGGDPLMLIFETSQSPPGVAVSLRAADTILNLTKVQCEIHLA